MGDEPLTLMKNGVAGVRAAVVSEYMGILFRLAKMVGNFALSAVSVLEIDYDIGSEF